ncbi:MAG TPA: hypothetical protein VGJ15_09210 [Pirellulales bacterium]
MIIRIAFAALIAFAAVAQCTAAVTIDFETVPGVTAVGFSAGTGVPPSGQLSSQLLSDGVVFGSTTAQYVALVDLGSGHATSGVQGIGGVTPTGGGNAVLDYSPIFVTFFLPNTATTAATDSVSIKIDQIPIAGNVFLKAFDINGNLVGSDSELDTDQRALTVAAAGIHSIEFYSESQTVAFDDLTFGDPLVEVHADAAAAPEAGSIFIWSTLGIFGVWFGRKAKRC